MKRKASRVCGAIIAAVLFAVLLPASLALASEDGVAREGGADSILSLQGNGSAENRAVVASPQVLAPQADLVASADATQVYSCSNGWQLEYEIAEDGTCAIVGLRAAGEGSTLTVPEKIDGREVTAIASKAFYGGTDGLSRSLTQIVLPNTIKTIGTAAFMGSGIQSMNVPASVQAIPQKCFASCKSLAEFTFEGDTLENIGEMAFNGCSELVQLDIPVLTTNIERKSYRIDRSCFYKCTKLETIVFHGDASTKSERYISNSDCFDYCKSLKNLVYYCKRSTIPRATGSDSSLSDVNVYHTMWFFRTLDDAKTGANPLYSITCLNTTKITDILAGTVSREDVLDDKGNFKAKPVWDESQALPTLVSGSSWGLVDVELENGDATLDDSYAAVMVSPDSLDYGWVTSETIEEFRKNNTNTGMTTSYPTYYIDNTGVVVNIGDLTAYGPDGSALPKSSYKLVFEMEKTTGSGSSANTTYESVAQPKEIGRYRVRAEGATSSNKGTKTPWVTFDVAQFKPKVFSYDAESASARLANAAQVAASATRAAKGKCAVVVPADDWRYQLIGAALAGAGSGFLLFDNRDDYSSRMTTAYIESGVNAVQIVGSTAKVPESRVAEDEAYLMDFLVERTIQSKTRYAKDTTVQLLADQVYTSIRDLKAKNNKVYGEGWSTTAIVASPNAWWDTLFIAQYAYSQKAPVFFVQDDGTLSATELDYLKNDGFTSVVLAGSATYVPDACAAAIKSACGITPKRMCSASDVMSSVLGVAGATENTYEYVAIANAESPADIVAASVLAASKGGIALPCAGTLDSKRAQIHLRSYLAKNGQTSIASLYLVGNLSSLDETLSDRLKSMWSEPMSTTLSAGDTIGMKDYTYRVAAGGKVTLTQVRNAAMTKATVGGITYAGKQFKLAGISSGAFSKCVNFKKLAFASGVATVPAKAFQNLKKLTAISLGSSVTSIGASAFSGCAALATVTGKGVKSIGANAFDGCGKLVVCAPLKTATTLGKSAFAKCASLRSVTLSAAKSVPAGAFSGCAKLLYASAPKAASVGASAFSGCGVLGTINAVSATKIGASVAAQDKKMKKLTLTKAVSIGKDAFSGCALVKILRLPAATTIGTSAFADCTSLKTLFATKATSIGASAFSKCSHLRSLSLPKATTLGTSAFADCAALETLSVPSATSIGASAFARCKALTSAKLDAKGLAKIGANAFNGCGKLASMSFKTTKLSAGTVGANALKGLPGKATISVPKTAVKAYKALFTSRGLAKGATVR